MFSISNIATRFKQRYQRFRQWQQAPISYNIKSADQHHCQNCHHDFTGNYCPYCSQQAGAGSITWSTVRQSVLNVWGAGNRSMPYSLIQLFGRTGHFIGDYISGRLQVSYPPLRMLLIIAVIIIIFQRLLGIDDAPDKVDGVMSSADALFFWMEDNPGWGILLIHSFLILPVWILFRYAPRHSHHTLPQGFFIQVFLGIIGLFCVCLAVFWDWLALIYFVYCFMAYYQLFGYSVWGTLWRFITCLFVGVIHFGLFLIIPDYFQRQKFHSDHIGLRIVVFATIILLTVIVLAIGNSINKRSATKQQ